MKDSNEEVSSSYSGTLLISELTEEGRKSVEESIKLLPKVFRECESYLRDYEAGEQNALKLLQAMNMVKRAIIESRSDLLKTHKIPNSLYPWLSE